MPQYKDLVKKISIPPEKKTKQKDYMGNGQLAIIDQGRHLIGGYIDDISMTLPCILPVIVFGDHTRAVKYVSFPFGVGADGIKVLQPKTGVFPKFLYYLTQYLVLNLEDRGYARHYQYLEKKEVNLPPMPEQERIVAHIEEMLSQLDNGLGMLKKTKQQLTVYRQAVFTSVINQHDGTLCKLSDVACTVDGDRGKDYPKREELKKDGYCLFLTAANVRPYGWSFRDKTFITEEKDKVLHGGKLQRNDIIITTRGTLGNVAVYDDTVPFDHIRINSCMLIIRVNVDGVYPYYLAQYLMSPMFRYEIAKLKSGTAQPQIPASILKEIQLKLPCKNAQVKIVAELNAKLSVCDSIEQAIDTTLQQAEALRQSILKKTFEGGL